MKKIFLLVALSLSVSFSWSQRNQTIAYIDMEYILENVPEYLEAQNTLDGKIAKWRKKLDVQARHIEVLKTDLANEKAILTKDLIEEKEEEITLKQEELRRLESLYFGPNGDMFSIRKQLVKPIQDKVYNAIQTITKRKKYDFVFDKSSDLVMLYSNKKYDISELVLADIERTRSIEAKNKKREEKKNAAKTNPNNELSAKQKEIKTRKEKAKAKQISAVEAKKKQIEEKRAALLKQREEKKQQLLNKKNETRINEKTALPNTEKTTTIQEDVKSIKADARAKKIAEAEAKKKQIAERREALLKQREEKRKLLREKKEALRKKKEQELKDKNKEQE